MTGMSEAERERLREVAAAANHDRPWEWSAVGKNGYPQQVIEVGPAKLIAELYEGPDFPSSSAEFIATFDPPTVLALLDALASPDARLAAVEGLLAAYGDDVPGGTAEFLVYQLRAALHPDPSEEIGGDECGDLLPGDENLPLSRGSEAPDLYAETSEHERTGWQLHGELVERSNRQRLHYMSVIDELKSLLRRACEADAREDCRYDHNGGCQAHGFLSEPCPYPLIRQYLATPDPSPAPAGGGSE